MAASGCLDYLIDPTRFGIYLGSGEGNQDFASFSEMVLCGLVPEGPDLSRFYKVA